jgi:hypothetical protein
VTDEAKPAGTQNAEAVISTALTSEIYLDLPVATIDPVEIYRYLGYPADAAPAPRLAEKIAGISAEALTCIRPRGAYSVHKVAGRATHSLKLGNTTISGNIGEYLNDASRVAVFAVTVGEEISHLATSKEGDAFAAWVVDATGSWAVESAADALMLRIRHHLQDGEELTLRYSPGYCGMEIGQQSGLFELVRAEAIGVTLMPSMLMHPLKSISGLVGLAPKAAVSQYHSPCDLCKRTDCPMRR